MEGKVDSAFLIFMALGVLYSITTFLCILRTIRLHKFSPEWRSSKFFYISVLLQVLIRAACFFLICARIRSISVLLLYLLISVPDSLFIVSYILLVWQMVAVFYYSHISLGASMNFLAKFTETNRRSKGSIAIVVSIVFWSVMQGIFYLLLIAGVIESDVIAREIGIANLVAPSCILGVMIYLQVRYSGIPTISNVWLKRMRKIFFVTLIWSLTRLLRGVLNLISEYATDEISSDISDNNQSIELLPTTFLVGVLILSEVVCVLIVLDYGFISIFVFSAEEAEENSNLTSPLVREQNLSRQTMVAPDPFIEPEEIEILEEFHSAKSKFGVICKARFQGALVAYRRINFSRISNYVLEEFNSQIETYKNLQSSQLVPIYSIVLKPPVLGFVTPYYSKSVFSLLHQEKLQLSMGQKLNIAKKTANCIKEVHNQGKAHGHLSSHNILLDSDLNPFVSDLGFHKIKKYAGIVFGYSNKSQWSSPEILSDKRLTPPKVHISDDSYSFGVILWELITGQEPYSGYSKEQIVQQVVVNSFRPKLPTDISEGLGDLIKSCWNRDPNSRPDFALICNSIERALGELV